MACPACYGIIGISALLGTGVGGYLKTGVNKLNRRVVTAGAISVGATFLTMLAVKVLTGVSPLRWNCLGRLESG